MNFDSMLILAAPVDKRSKSTTASLCQNLDLLECALVLAVSKRKMQSFQCYISFSAQLVFNSEHYHKLNQSLWSNLFIFYHKKTNPSALGLGTKSACLDRYYLSALSSARLLQPLVLSACC